MKKIKIHTDKTGSLVPISLRNNIPFKTKRIFIIHGKKKHFRADHAHYKCSQFIIPLCGTAIAYYVNKKRKFKKKLSYKENNGLLLKPMTWCKIKFNTNESKLMVFCNREYEFSDYIEKYSVFLGIINR